MNENIVCFNKHVDVMLKNCFPEVWFRGVFSFLDNCSKLHYVKLMRVGDSSNILETVG